MNPPRAPDRRVRRTQATDVSRQKAGLVVLFCRIDRALKTSLERAARTAGQGEAELVRELLAEALAARDDQRPGAQAKEERLLARL
jgi:hypothetical protein